MIIISVESAIILIEYPFLHVPSVTNSKPSQQLKIIFSSSIIEFATLFPIIPTKASTCKTISKL